MSEQRDLNTQSDQQADEAPENARDYDELQDVLAERDDDEDTVDVDTALESVASLSDVIAEREAAEAAEQAREEEAYRQEAEEQAKREAYYLPRPPLTSLARGQLASVVPALILMGLGAWLSFSLATGTITLNLPVLVLGAMSVVGVVLLAQWISSGRWAAGVLFSGVTLLAAAGVVAYLAAPDSVGAEGWPLLIGAVGLGALLSGLLSRGVHRQQVFVGLSLVVAAGAGYAVATDAVSLDMDALQPVLLAVLGTALVALLILPAAARRRG